MDHPHFHLLAYPGSHELGKRLPIELDWLRLVRHARQRGCFLELNVQPKRLDLTVGHARRGRRPTCSTRGRWMSCDVCCCGG